jgi:hypothetical protein
MRQFKPLKKDKPNKKQKERFIEEERKPKLKYIQCYNLLKLRTE